jgi:CxxC-x17-CxxC domain-containing protein
MSDRVVVCRDCGQEFTFTAGEQAFYQERGFSEPTRCKACRDKRKTERNAGGYDSYGSGGGGSSSYGSSTSGGYGGGGGRGYSSGPREMFPAVCTSCGKETEVPFQPTAGKPVYCQDCFRENRRSSQSYGSRY